MNIATGFVVGLATLAAYLYYRPPQGDLEPISDEALKHLIYQQGKKGDFCEYQD